jgi:hypothetical protein
VVGALGLAGGTAVAVQRQGREEEAFEEFLVNG